MSRENKTSAAANDKSLGLGPLVAEVRALIVSARHAAASTVNTLQVLTNFEIGRRIVEHVQKGAERAKYGTKLLKELSAQLTEEFGRGFSERNLDYMRRFFLVWRDRVSQIAQHPVAQLTGGEENQHNGNASSVLRISQQPIAE